MDELKKVVPPSAKDAMKQVLEEMGVDVENSPHFDDTPRRFTNYLLEFMQPYDPKEDLSTMFPATSDHGMVVQSHIPFTAVCAHHLVPFLGKAHVAYIPRQRVVGLSKLTRVVQGVAHRSPSVQEDIGNEVADAFMKFLEPAGVAVVIHATHGCMACRGVAQPGVITSTSAMRGAFRDVPHAREEFLELVKGSKDI